MRRADPWLHGVIQANIKLLRTSPWTTPQPEAAHDRMASRCQKPHVLKVCRCPRLVARSETTNTVQIIRTMPHASMMATFAYKLRAETGVCKNTRESNAESHTHQNRPFMSQAPRWPTCSSRNACTAWTALAFTLVSGAAFKTPQIITRTVHATA